MAMRDLTVGEQTIRYDADATAAIYRGLGNGWAEDCGCVGCRNFLAQRSEIYPAAFRDLLLQLGIDPNKESEVVADGPMENGLHHYGGWFFFIGEMVSDSECLSIVREAPCFECSFARFGPCPKEFRDRPRLAVQFNAHFRWVLSDSWDSDLWPAAVRPPKVIDGHKSDPA
ncbi:MAG: hypothetical protein J0H49_00475 [Acidobacteria bacterium]|nr:hypothetical protein [Acidobacteriota bacterium]